MFVHCLIVNFQILCSQLLNVFYMKNYKFQFLYGKHFGSIVLPHVWAVRISFYRLCHLKSLIFSDVAILNFSNKRWRKKRYQYQKNGTAGGKKSYDTGRTGRYCKIIFSKVQIWPYRDEGMLNAHMHAWKYLWKQVSCEAREKKTCHSAYWSRLRVSEIYR